MTTQFSLAAANAGVNAMAALVDAGSPSPGLFKIFTGAMPATPETADSGTLLYSTTFSSTAFGSASGGVATANTIASTTASNTGTAGYWRMYDAGGTCIAQGDVGTSGTSCIVNTTSFLSGQTVNVTSFTLTLPGV